MVSVTVSVWSLYGLCTETKLLKAATTVIGKSMGFPNGLCYGGLCAVSVLPWAPRRLPPSPFAPRQSPARPRRGQRRKAVDPKGRTAFFTRGGLGPGLGRRPSHLLLVRFLIAFLRRQRLCVEKRTQNIEFHKLAVTSATTCWKSHLRIGSWRRQCNTVFCLQCIYAQGVHW